MNDLNEAEWLACAGTPGRMVRFLRRRHPLKDNPAYRRKLRLFACAVCRHLRQLLKGKVAAKQLTQSEQAVAVAERFADGLAGKGQLRRLRESLGGTTQGDDFRKPGHDLRHATLGVATGGSWQAALMTLDGGYWTACAGLEPVPDYLRARCVEVRDIFGNPFRPATLDASWRRGPGNAAVKLAQGIYEQRAFDRLPVLADALEEAGCPSGDLTAHCRAPTPHLPGCWAVDLLLGKS
jgi:hypothetical protein